MFDRLKNTFTVTHITTPVEQLRRADSRSDAEHLFAAFDVIPYPRQGPVCGFFQRNEDQLQSLLPEHLLSENTSVMELPLLFLESRFYFVFAGREVAGYVHYSDLNKADAKVPFFALYQLVERALWDSASQRISRSLLEQLFEEQEVARFVKRQEQIAGGNVDVGWAGVFTFPLILRIARHLGRVDLTDSEIGLLRNVRNSIAHSDRNLVEDLEAVEELAKAYRIFRRLLRVL